MKKYKREFRKFLKKYAKRFDNSKYSWQAWCEDLENQYLKSGCIASEYMLTQAETKDNQVHIFYY